PRLDFSTDKAWLGQLYHPAEGWDYMFGEWAFSSAEVTMLLAAGYLTKVSSSADVAMPVAAFGSAVASSGSQYVDETLPETEVGLYGNGRVGIETFYATNPGSAGYFGGYYPWDGVIERSFVGSVFGVYDRIQYSAISENTTNQSGFDVLYSATNSKLFDSRYEQTTVPAQTIHFADVGAFDTTIAINMTGDSNNLYWGNYYTYTNPPSTGFNANPPGPFRGSSGFNTSGFGIAGSTCTRLHEEQNGCVSISVDGTDIVSVAFYRHQSSGPKPEYSPVTGYYASHLANPTGAIGTPSGMGVGNYFYISAYSDPATDITWIRSYHGIWNPTYSWYDSPPEAVDTINAKYTGLRDALVAQTYFSSEASSGIYRGNYYTATINPSVTLDNSSMSWSSKDFILYDETNGVYISVESSFVGIDTTATLTVSLKVQTRHHTTTQTLGEYSYTYSQLVQEREIGSSGKYAMPSPQIRAIFAPLYQEQGSFKGAHYVTEEEENNGATPAHL
ncbi:hypothetical protein KC887_09705, partial [Candidatus Kaiserbacteria bacterium]|nr:hypothetical protein [Candidatus Kaiserbacteria bacterium]